MKDAEPRPPPSQQHLYSSKGNLYKTVTSKNMAVCLVKVLLSTVKIPLNGSGADADESGGPHEIVEY